MRLLQAVLIASLLPLFAAASPSDDVAARFVDVLRSDDLARLGQFVDLTQSDLRAWEEFRDIVNRFDCVSIDRYEATAVSQSEGRLTLRVHMNGTAALKAAWRPVRALPRRWHIEARFVDGAWHLWRAVTEERRIGLAMAAAATAAEAESIAVEASEAADVNYLEVMAAYARELESRRDAALSEHAVAMARATGDVETEVIALRSVARMTGSGGALQATERAEKVARAAGNPDALARALLIHGLSCLLAGDRDRAVATYAACAAMIDVVDDPTMSMKCQQMFLHSTWSSRSLLDSLRAAETLGAMANRYGWEEGQELGLFNQSTIQSELGNADMARALNERLIPLAERNGNRAFTAFAMFNLAGIDKTEGFLQRARTRLLTLLGLSGIGDQITGEALVMLAGLHIELNELAEAEQVLDRAAPITMPPPQVYPKVLLTRAEIQLRRGEAEQAIATTHEALKYHAQSYEGTTDFHVQASLQRMLARGLSAAGRHDEAIAELRKAVAMVETAQELRGADALGLAAFLTSFADLYVQLVELLVARGEVDEAFRVAEQMKSRGLREAISSSRINLSASFSAEDQVRETTLQAKVVEINRAVLAARQKQQPLAELEEQLESARRDLDAFRSEMRIKHPSVERKRFDVAPTLELPAGEESLALVEYVVAPTQVIAFVVRRDAPIRAVRIPMTKNDLVRDARELENLVAARSPEYRQMASRLYAKLLAPLEAHLPPGGTLAIVPDGVLWNVPFHALVAGDGRHVVDRQPVFYAHSLHLLRQASTLHTSASSGLFALGNPSIGAQARSTFRSVYRDTPLETLIDAEVEVRSVSSMYPSEGTRVYYRAAATENAFKKEASGYSVIHIAAHAIIDDRAPLYSALVLANSSANEDGLLEAREVVDLPLNADLAVLSACDTARGQIGSGEGVIGLSWAFFAAGCPTTVVSQWRAESAATSKLMIEFHRRLRAGDTTAEALRRAQMAVRRVEKYKHPFYWAPFIAIGAAG
jgi:CHAT domain-containing protein